VSRAITRDRTPSTSTSKADDLIVNPSDVYRLVLFESKLVYSSGIKFSRSIASHLPAIAS